MTSAFLARFQGKIGQQDKNGNVKECRHERDVPVNKSRRKTSSIDTMPPSSHAMAGDELALFSANSSSHFGNNEPIIAMPENSTNQRCSYDNDYQDGPYHEENLYLHDEQVLHPKQNQKPSVSDLQQMMMRRSMQMPPCVESVSNNTATADLAQNEVAKHCVTNKVPRSNGLGLQPDIENYYQQRPKRAPAKSRETFLDHQQRDPYQYHGHQKNPNRLNEAHIQSAKDQLHYSKKARPVNYEPKTLQEYKQNLSQTYQTLGKLQPDLNTEELVSKRANQQRIKEFSANLRQVNRQTAGEKPFKKHTNQPKKELSKREKALEFAKKVPVPRTKKDANAAGVTHAAQRTKERRLGAQEVKISALDALEMKHEAARADVEAIRMEMQRHGL